MLRADSHRPNAENATDAELLVAMEAAPNKRSFRRLAAIRALLIGMERVQVAAVFWRSERMVRLWTVRFNQGGIDDGLSALRMTSWRTRLSSRVEFTGREISLPRKNRPKWPC